MVAMKKVKTEWLVPISQVEKFLPSPKYGSQQSPYQGLSIKEKHRSREGRWTGDPTMNWVGGLDRPQFIPTGVDPSDTYWPVGPAPWRMPAPKLVCHWPIRRRPAIFLCRVLERGHDQATTPLDHSK